MVKINFLHKIANIKRKIVCTENVLDDPYDKKKLSELSISSSSNSSDSNSSDSDTDNSSGKNY